LLEEGQIRQEESRAKQAKNRKRNPRITQHEVLSPVTGQDVRGIHLPLEKSELPGGESPIFAFATNITLSVPACFWPLSRCSASSAQTDRLLNHSSREVQTRSPHFQTSLSSGKP
jgi:hypothetical protein